MKIAVISDSHDHLDLIQEAIQISNRMRCELLIHLGDIVSPYTASHLEKFKGRVLGVYGNCDGDKLGIKQAFENFGGEIFPSPYTFEQGGRKFAIMHEPYFLDELILSQGFSYLFYGHMHSVDHRVIEKTTVINPGEVAGISNPPTFFTGDTAADKFELVELT